MKINPVFRFILSVLLISSSFIFLSYAAFGVNYVDPSSQLRVIDTISGYLFGLVTPIVAFFFAKND